MSGGFEASRRERRHRHREVTSGRRGVHRMLMRRRICQRRVPYASHRLAGEPVLVAWMQPDDRAALRTDQVLHRDTDGPSEPRGLRDDLVGGVNRLGAANLRDRLHLLDRREHLHADGGGAKPQQRVEVIDDGLPVVGGLPRRGCFDFFLRHNHRSSEARMHLASAMPGRGATAIRMPLRVRFERMTAECRISTMQRWRRRLDAEK